MFAYSPDSIESSYNSQTKSDTDMKLTLQFTSVNELQRSFRSCPLGSLVVLTPVKLKSWKVKTDFGWYHREGLTNGRKTDD